MGKTVLDHLTSPEASQENTSGQTKEESLLMEEADLIAETNPKTLEDFYAADTDCESAESVHTETEDEVEIRDKSYVPSAALPTGEMKTENREHGKFGLSGGVGDKRTSKLTRGRQTKELLLSNTRNDCFVNSTLKLIRATNLASYLNETLDDLANLMPNKEITVGNLMRDLFNSRGEQSSSAI